VAVSFTGPAETHVDASLPEPERSDLSQAIAPLEWPTGAAADSPPRPVRVSHRRKFCPHSADPLPVKLHGGGARCAPHESAHVGCPQEVVFRLETSVFVLYVSSHEEHVIAQVRVGDGKTFELGALGHNQLLLLLARRRLADEKAGFAATSCGWVHPDDYPFTPEFERSRVNLAVFRVRERLRRLGFVDADGIIERRRASQEIRIGVRQPLIVPL
jgi:hypothetical protein